jgi:hypothetical protein
MTYFYNTEREGVDHALHYPLLLLAVKPSFTLTTNSDFKKGLLSWLPI